MLGWPLVLRVMTIGSRERGSEALAQIHFGCLCHSPKSVKATCTPPACCICESEDYSVTAAHHNGVTRPLISEIPGQERLSTRKRPITYHGQLYHLGNMEGPRAFLERSRKPRD